MLYCDVASSGINEQPVIPIHHFYYNNEKKRHIKIKQPGRKNKELKEKN